MDGDSAADAVDVAAQADELKILHKKVLETVQGCDGTRSRMQRDDLRKELGTPNDIRTHQAKSSES